MSDDIFIGQIIGWSETIIPENWQICDGTGGTPDLRGSFIYGKLNDADTPITGGTSSHGHSGGGSSSVSSHNHSFSGTTDESGGSYQVPSVATTHSYGGHTHGFSGTTGNDGGHSHTTSLSSSTSLPPYVNLYYIMKVA